MRVLGLMSGTSMDGVDACLMETDGVAPGEVLGQAFRPYSEAQRAALVAVQGRWPEERGLEAAAEIVLEAHAEIAGGFEDLALIGFHGQTLAHDPEAGRTHQLGDGAALARRLGCPVAWDFRSADMAAGGQGAPLAPFYHHALVRAARLEGITAVLNLGGVGNVSMVDGSLASPEMPGAILAFDTGPANALLDDFMKARTGTARDTDGAAALAGVASEAIVAEAMSSAYFERPPPKSLDRGAFDHVQTAVRGLSTEDGAATLTEITARTVARAEDHATPQRWLVCGGGRRNPAMMAALERALEAPVQAVEALGWDGDMLEAQAFAWLAKRVSDGRPISGPGTTGVPHPITGGRLSTP